MSVPIWAPRRVVDRMVTGLAAAAMAMGPYASGWDATRMNWRAGAASASEMSQKGFSLVPSPFLPAILQSPGVIFWLSTK